MKELEAGVYSPVAQSLFLGKQALLHHNMQHLNTENEYKSITNLPGTGTGVKQ
jgi:hypothetical protein